MTFREKSRAVVSGGALLGMLALIVGCASATRPPSEAAPPPTVLSPAALRSLFSLESDETGRGQVIVVTEVRSATRKLALAVDAFSSHFGLPPVCTPPRAAGCFRLRIVTRGRLPRAGAHGPSEADLDVEWIHAIAPLAEVVVLTTKQPLAAVQEVGRLARSGSDHVFSTSWCSPCHGAPEAAQIMLTAWDSSCDLPHVVCVNASGDAGPPGWTPANSPYLLAVGATVVSRTRGDRLKTQVAWPRSGGGATDWPAPLPSWQRRLACGASTCRNRMIPDVSAPAGKGPTVYSCGRRLCEVDGLGTSLSGSLWAALIALANQKLAEQNQPPIGIDELHSVLYGGGIRAGLGDITQGERARPGWDSATGWGSPKAGIVGVLVSAIRAYRDQRR